MGDGRELAALLVAQGVTQSEVAREMGRTSPWLSHALRSSTLPDGFEKTFRGALSRVMSRKAEAYRAGARLVKEKR